VAVEFEFLEDSVDALLFRPRELNDHLDRPVRVAGLLIRRSWAWAAALQPSGSVTNQKCDCGSLTVRIVPIGFARRHAICDNPPIRIMHCPPYCSAAFPCRGLDSWDATSLWLIVVPGDVRWESFRGSITLVD